MKTYVELSQSQIEKTFIDDSQEWYLVESQDGVGEVQTGSDVIDSPMHAFAVWSNGELALRFVLDRGCEHIDIECIDSNGIHSWVPFEIVGLAAGLWDEEHYKNAVHEWYTQLDVEDPNTPSISLFSDPLREISRNMIEIIITATNPQEISKAADLLSHVTAQSLKKIGEKYQKRDKKHRIG